MQWIHDTARHNYSIAAVNISLANPFYSDDQAECDQFGGNGAAAGAYAAMVATLRADGIPVVIGAGNDNNFNGPSFPSCVSGAISVGAVDKNDQLWFDPLTGAGTNSGQLMDMWAPGGGGSGGSITGDYAKGIVSSKPGNAFGSFCELSARSSSSQWRKNPRSFAFARGSAIMRRDVAVI